MPDTNRSIIVVSGLPRSGTSLVMQMLAAGGIEPLTDSLRSADEDNPRGYYELDAVKRLAADSTWVPKARGKAVKVISHLVPHLPATESYRVVLVERDLEEVLASQAKMIERLGRTAPPMEVVRKAFESHRSTIDQVLAKRPEFESIRVKYVDLIATPEAEAARLAEFVGANRPTPPDVEAMVGAVHPSLYRNRRNPS